MSLYTITPDFLTQVDKEEQSYFSDILFVFSHRGNRFKVTKDVNGEVISIYRSIKQNADIIKFWLDMMTFSPSAFEKVNVRIDDIECLETKFVKLCKETKSSNKLIVYSKENIEKFHVCNNKIQYEDIEITVLDRDDAKNALLPVQHIEIRYDGCQIVDNGSVISKSNIKK